MDTWIIYLFFISQCICVYTYLHGQVGALASSPLPISFMLNKKTTMFLIILNGLDLN